MNEGHGPCLSPAEVESFDAVVIGAGIAGLRAADELLRSGHRTLVVDKGRGVGGRMATRRVGGATFDHGAQYVHARGPAFAELIATARDAGEVVEWCHGVPELSAGAVDRPATVSSRTTAWRGAAGMTAPAKWLANELAKAGAVVRTSHRVTAIDEAGDRVLVRFEHGGLVAATGAVVTPPVPQVIELLEADGLIGRVVSGTREELDAVRYEPCFAVLIVLERPSLIPPPGCIRFLHAADAGPLSPAVGTEDDKFPLAWIADNRIKGISESSCLTLHATPAFSRRRFDANPDDVASELIEAARPWIDGGRTGVVEGVKERVIHRWKYALVARGIDKPFLVIHDSPPIAVCGDAFGGPRVEGAADSGQAAGRWLARRIE